MAIPPSHIIVGFLIISVVYAVTKSLYTSISHRRKSKALGCLPPKRAVTRGPFGWYTYKDTMNAARTAKLLDFFWDRFIQNGNTFEQTVLGRRAIVTAEPENIKAILATQFNDFSLGSRHKVFYPLLGDGIFTLDGAGWSHSRAMLRPQFSREQVADVAVLNEHVSQLIALIPSDGSAFDIQELFFRLTLDTATEFLLGESTNCLAEEEGEEGEEGLGRAATGPLAGIGGGQQGFADAFNKSQDYVAYRSRTQDLSKLMDNDAEARKSIKIVHDVVDWYVDRALTRRLKLLGGAAGEAEISGSKSSSASRYVFLDAMISETQDRKILRDQMLNILLAGRDTTASLLSSAFWYMARNLRVWQRLRDDIRATFPPEEGSGDDKITISRIREVRYLRHFLNEVLRLLPPVPANSRCAVDDTTLPLGGGPDGKSPIFIPKGGKVVYVINNMHRRADLWGEDALEFRPERWEENGKHGWEYLPFNGGPRICLGQQYALAEASYVLVRLLQRFDRLENGQPEVPDLRVKFSLTACHALGVKVKLFTSEK